MIPPAVFAPKLPPENLNAHERTPFCAKFMAEIQIEIRRNARDAPGLPFEFATRCQQSYRGFVLQVE